MKRFKTSFILFLVLIIVALYSYFIEYKKGNKTKEIKQFSEQVLPIKAENVSNIEILNQEDKIVLTLNNSNWEIVEPLKWPAITSVVSDLLVKLSEPSSLIKPEPSSEDLKAYGITDSNKLSIILKNQKKYFVSFGDKSPVAEERYVYTESEVKRITLAKEELFTSFNKKLDDYRDKLIFKDLNISKIDFNKFSFSKEADIWLANNKDIVLDQNLVNKFAGEILDLKAKSFVFNKEQSEALISKAWKLYKLRFSNLKITSDELAFDFYTSSKNGKKYFAYKTSGGALSQIFEVENFDIFNKKFDEFRKKDIFSPGLDNVSGIEIINDSNLIMLTKNKENEWLSGSELVLDKVKVNSFIDNIKSTQVVNFINNTSVKKYGFEKIKKTLIFKNEDNKIVLKVDFGNIVGDLVAVLFEGRIYEINKDILDKFNLEAFSNN